MLENNLLITGGAGFIGSEFVRQAVDSQRYSTIIVYDKLTYAGKLERIKSEIESGKIQFIHDDLLNIANHFKNLCKVNQVVHFAAESHVDNSIEAGKVFIDSNIVGTYVLIEFFRLINPGIRILIASTDEVYGSLESEAADESSNLAPSSPYSASKASADLLALANFNTHKQNILITRTCNNYGPHQDVEKFIPRTISNLLEGEKAIIYGTGNNIREWIHVSDNCKAIRLALNYGTSGEIYNIGTDFRISNLEIVNKIMNELGISKNKVTFVNDRLGHDFRYALNSSKFSTNFKWSPEISFETGIISTIKWHISQIKGR